MRYDYHMIVIGGGSAGLVTAAGAAGLGARVALVEGHKMGGDCLNTGCVPSKTFLKSAHLAQDMKDSPIFGLTSDPVTVDFSKIMARVHEVIKTIEPHDSQERFEQMGVEVIRGYASFKDAHTIQVNQRTLSAKFLVIATGAKPMIPDIPGLDQVPYETTETLFDMVHQPKQLIVIGSGSIGLELGQAFAQLGTGVTILSRSSRLFEQNDPEVGTLMTKSLEASGLKIQLSAKILKVYQEGQDLVVTYVRDGLEQTIKGDQLLLATGRRPDTDSLDLAKAGVQLDKHGSIQVDDALRTSVKNIYACGDVVGPYKFTHMAAYQAGLVIRNALLPWRQKVNYRHVPRVTYTKPEVAHVGDSEQALINKGLAYKTYFQALETTDRGRTEGEEGFLKVITNPKGVVIGATMVGPKAGEQIGLANLAIQKKMRLRTFASMIFPYPTELEIYKSLAMMALKESFKPWHKTLIQKIFLR